MLIFEQHKPFSCSAENREDVRIAIAIKVAAVHLSRCPLRKEPLLTTGKCGWTCPLVREYNNAANILKWWPNSDQYIEIAIAFEIDEIHMVDW